MEVAEVAFVVAAEATAETATEATVEAAGAAIAETATEAIGVAEAVEAMAVGMEAMVVMTKDPIKKDSYGYDRREPKITAILLNNNKNVVKYNSSSE